MKIKVDIQRATDAHDIPENRQIRKWARTALSDYGKDAELTIRIVDKEEGEQRGEGEDERRCRNGARGRGSGSTHWASLGMQVNVIQNGAHHTNVTPTSPSCDTWRAGSRSNSMLPRPAVLLPRCPHCPPALTAPQAPSFTSAHIPPGTLFARDPLLL